jgi:PAS domain S-box-containing protein
MATVVSWNKGAARIKGYTADEIIGQHFSRFYPADAIERYWPQQELELAKAQGRFEDEGWRLRKDGSQFWANVNITRSTTPTASCGASPRSPAT